jgi:uncharacterized membrane protein
VFSRSGIPKVFKEGVLCPGATRTDPKVKVTLSVLVLTQIFQMALINNCPEPVESKFSFYTLRLSNNENKFLTDENYVKPLE